MDDQNWQESFNLTKAPKVNLKWLSKQESAHVLLLNLELDNRCLWLTKEACCFENLFSLSFLEFDFCQHVQFLSLRPIFRHTKGVQKNLKPINFIAVYSKQIVIFQLNLQRNLQTTHFLRQLFVWNFFRMDLVALQLIGNHEKCCFLKTL